MLDIQKTKLRYGLKEGDFGHGSWLTQVPARHLWDEPEDYGSEKVESGYE